METLIKLIDFKPLEDERGFLVALESHKEIPFDIKRVYYIFGSRPDVARGFHAHKALKQVLICLAGKCRLVLDDGVNRETLWMDSPTAGLIIEHMIWREMYEFSEDCVLLVVASDYYDESDYIRDYKVFKEISWKA